MPETIHLANPEATEALGRRLAPHLTPGDTILLSGPVGAGKSTLARAIIAARLAAFGTVDDIPSPSFTLVQTYSAGDTTLWHADLYRLSGPDEVTELGLVEAFDDAVTLVEWPDRLGPLRPKRALAISLSATPHGRLAEISAQGGRWEAIRSAIASPPREEERAAFLSQSYIAEAPVPFAGDASTRRYFRAGGRVLMDWPDAGPGIDAFTRITDRLRRIGLSAPTIYNADPDRGFLLLEDLGDALFARWLEAEPGDEGALYAAAVDVLARIQKSPAEGLPAYDDAILSEEVRRFALWYVPVARGHALPPPEARALEGLTLEAVAALPTAPTVPVLVDFHAENLIWLPARTGAARVGLLDYQDARAGHPAYDLVSLLEDARRDVSDATRSAALNQMSDASGTTIEDLGASMAVFGAQRNLKILGLFARLARRDGRPDYLRHMPRVWGHLMRDLAHPRLTALRDWVDRTAPPPTPDVLARMQST
ncbi:MAG: tRNA (adenosine(37)-N6)-threonylcarbamoyltransferase complex ATPase subunit type 1 TsaE [Pseudomonadota bacterium]